MPLKFFCAMDIRIPHGWENYLSWYFFFGQRCLNASYFIFLCKSDSESSIYKPLLWKGGKQNVFCLLHIKEEISGSIGLSLNTNLPFLLDILKTILSR